MAGKLAVGSSINNKQGIRRTFITLLTKGIPNDPLEFRALNSIFVIAKPNFILGLGYTVLLMKSFLSHD